MSENNHPINEVLHTTMDKIREMVDANTVVGQPIVTQDGVTLIPVSRLSFGFATGGSDFGKTQNVPKNFGDTAHRRWSWPGSPAPRPSGNLPCQRNPDRAPAGGHCEPGGGPGAGNV